VKEKVLEPFFFGKAHRRLFGCCHYPSKNNYRREAVILCQTIGHEYVHSHRAIFQLAMRLASIGFMTLRFDYFGCGDSNGNFEEGSLDSWVEDVKTAIEEMQIRTGIRNVCLVGCRIGATLALKAATKSTSVKYLVLWEVVNNGLGYLQEAARMQGDLSRALGSRIDPSQADVSLPSEMMGFPFTTELIQDFKALALTTSDIPSGCKSLTICNREMAPTEFTLDMKTTSEENTHEIRYIEDTILWRNELYRRLIPRKTIDEISLWMKNVIS